MNTIKWTAICGLGIVLSFLSPFFLQAQCTDNTQSTNMADAWLSCETTENPNTDRGMGHWLLYDLGYTYGMGTTTFWNYNIAGETGKGFKQVAIDYSLDGTTWTEAGVFQLAQASGSSDYTGINGLDLTDINARYVLITALSTWNGGSCAGLSEVRFNINALSGVCGDIDITIEGVEGLKEITVSIFPNPTKNHLTIQTNVELKEMIIINSVGHEIIRVPPSKNIDISFLPNGMYFLKLVAIGNQVVTKWFVKQ